MHVMETIRRKRGWISRAVVRETEVNPKILGYTITGSDVIFINKIPLQSVKEGYGEEVANSYLFVVLLHEYLHVLGIYDEREVRKITLEVVNEIGDKNALKFAEQLAFPYDVQIIRGIRANSYM